ncbi:MAG TPA: NRDE family protein [Acetobacteraceae bacterium]|nr:NRDE family protein [Acetobacteraceae bacterium]
MCTVVLRIAPGEQFPILLAANRDERVDRPWDPPAAWWPDQPDIVGGRDRSAGGTWMAVNGAGVVCCVLNRPGSLGPAPGKESRGILPLRALEKRTARDAANVISAFDAGKFRPFNLILADTDAAIFQRADGSGPIESFTLPPGVHMVTAHDPDDHESPRVARYLPRFRAAPPPDPASGNWEAWTKILADRSGAPGSEINVPVRAGFATVSSSLLALRRRGAVIWLFAAGPPDRAPFLPIALATEEIPTTKAASG